MHSDDAVKASRIIDCIYLSNHGGRQLDLAPSPIQILPEVRKSLKKEQDLIGFCGAPWTLSCYMIETRSSKDFNRTRLFLWNNEKIFDKLMIKNTK